MKKKAPTPAPATQPHGGFEEWRKAKRGSQVEDAIQWRAAYHAAIQSQSASAEVIEMLVDGQKNGLWKFLTGADDKPFADFPAFCAADLPFGLAKPVDELRRFRRVLKLNADRAAPPTTQRR